MTGSMTFISNMRKKDSCTYDPDSKDVFWGDLTAVKGFDIHSKGVSKAYLWCRGISYHTHYKSEKMQTSLRCYVNMASVVAASTALYTSTALEVIPIL